MPVFQYTKLLEVEARGGLSEESIKLKGYGDKGYTPTRSGRFIIQSLEKHVSGGRWIYSMIPWGTPLRIDKDVLYVQLNGKWRKLSDTDPRWLRDYKTEAGLRDQIISDQKALYDEGEELPKLDSWVFNDFGHISIKYFRDRNKNGIYDREMDELMSDFIHTTPRDEIKTATAIRDKVPASISLAYSHGCIHMKPNDIDKLIHSGYARRGVTIEIHPYTAVPTVPSSFTDKIGNPPYELHFFPARSTEWSNLDGKGKLVVYNVTNVK